MSASFPGAIKSFASRSAGQTIDPSHVNDLQDEVTAIETALLTGPITLAASTLASLSVTGNSTLAAINGGATTLASLTVTAPAPSVRVIATAAQNIASASVTAVTFDTQRWMTASGMHSTASNPTRVKPDSSGLYAIVGNVLWQGGSTGAGVCNAGIRIDGSSIISFVQDVDLGALAQNVAAQYYFASTGQYAELIVTQNSGSTKSMSATADHSPSLTMTKCR